MTATIVSSENRTDRGDGGCLKSAQGRAHQPPFRQRHSVSPIYPLHRNSSDCSPNRGSVPDHAHHAPQISGDLFEVAVVKRDIRLRSAQQFAYALRISQ